MTLDIDDTIAAISSAPGGALRGIVRVSGPSVLNCCAGCFVPNDDVQLEGIRTATSVAGQFVIDAHCSLPCDLYLWPTKQSYTRQPTAEVHTLGSPPLLDAILEQVCVRGARLAKPGEFTLRAFLAGRLDLAQAEAVLGVIDSQSQKQLQVALQQLAGGLSNSLTDLRNQLLDLCAEIEAGLDFAEEDVQFISPQQLNSRLSDALVSVSALLQRMSVRGQHQHRPRIVLEGWPNVGKSSLVNRLADRSVSIVADERGTTRDYVTAIVDCAGIKCEFVDTAGVCHSEEELSRAAQSVSRKQLKQAELNLFCLDASRPPNDWELKQLSNDPATPRIVVLTKSDQAIGRPMFDGAIVTSSRTGEGIDTLRQATSRAIRNQASLESSVVTGTAARCRNNLRLAHEALQRTHQIAQSCDSEELVAAEVRLAAIEIGKIVGEVYTDDVLDRIFTRFCIGK